MTNEFGKVSVSNGFEMARIGESNNNLTRPSPASTHVVVVATSTPPQPSHSTTRTMTRKSVTIHSSLLFDPKKKVFVKNVSIKVDTERGSITEVYTRESEDEVTGGIDLRGRVVMPGFVDAHTHVFLHPYR